MLSTLTPRFQELILSAFSEESICYQRGVGTTHSKISSGQNYRLWLYDQHSIVADLPLVKALSFQDSSIHWKFRGAREGKRSSYVHENTWGKHIKRISIYVAAVTTFLKLESAARFSSSSLTTSYKVFVKNKIPFAFASH